MKKITLSLLFLFICATSLYAQITQEQADTIVQERIINETRTFTLYAQDIVQTDYTVLTSANEKLTLNYTCRVYYAKFTEETTGKYLIVKESNGNVLEVNAKNDDGPEDFEEWREVVSYPIEVPFTEYSLSETLCLWKGNIENLFYNDITVINSMEELDIYISCADGDYPEIDFSQYSLLLVGGSRTFVSTPVDIGIASFTQLPGNKYKLEIELKRYSGPFPFNGCTDRWIFAIVTSKINPACELLLHINSVSSSIRLKNIPFPLTGDLIVINSSEEFDIYFEYPEGTKPSIDFSQHTFLLANGYKGGTETATDFQLVKNGENIYTLDIKLFGLMGIASSWILKLLIGKLTSDATIMLNLH